MLCELLIVLLKMTQASVVTNVQNTVAGGMVLPNGETLIKRFRISSANDKLKAGSWMKIEKWG